MVEQKIQLVYLLLFLALLESKDHQDELKHKQQAVEKEMDSTVKSVSTLEDNQSSQEQTLALHGTQLADNSEKIAQTSSEISILRCQQNQLEVCIEQLSAERNKQTSEFKDELSLSKQQKGKLHIIYTMTPY